jgi:hypothetical protein
MGLLMGQFWLRTFRFNWFGHQSRFIVPLKGLGLLRSSSFMKKPPCAVFVDFTITPGAREHHMHYPFGQALAVKVR